jgi:hypothetical protein
MRLALGILVVLLAVPRTSLAQAANPIADDARIVVDVNVLGSTDSLAKDRQFQSRFIRFGEVGSSFATYPEPSRTITFVDVGVSYRLTPWSSVGIAYSRTDRDDGVGLGATIPHPTFFASPATGSGGTGEELTRRESATHLYFGFPLRIKGAEVRGFVGPTFFSLKADMVQEVLYLQTHDPASPQQAITVSGFRTAEAKGSDVGFHAGGDATFYVTRMVGVAGGVRFSQGTVTLDPEPLSQVAQEIRVGGTVIFVGLRLRVGG